MKQLAYNFHELRVVFDFYDERSLKNATRDRRGKMESNLRFIVEVKTPIKMSLNRFVKDVKVKQDLSMYLAGNAPLSKKRYIFRLTVLFSSDFMFNAMITIQFLFAGKCREYFKASNIRYLVYANHITEGNISCEPINNSEERG